jgi:(p)ppGpp synthase/HD superfamily hydrolase
LNPRAFGSWVRGGYLARDGDRRWLTDKGRERADSHAEADSTAAAPVLTGRFQRAFTVACEVHAGQLRKGTRIPYLAHLLSVAALVLEHGGGEDAAIGGLLHDAVENSEDGTQMERRIRGEFGDHVAGIVMGCSDAVAVPGQPTPPWRDRKAAYLARLAGEDDPDVLLVSACDKLHNARAIITGLRAAGPALWDRSKAGPADQLWYYQSLASCYQCRVSPALSDELNQAIRQMQQMQPPGIG